MPNDSPLPEIDLVSPAPDIYQLPAVLQEPRAGGNYLRDPVTGALTLNPDHPAAPGNQE